MVKDVFKAEKVTLFVIDRDMQAAIFRKKGERAQNYKRMILDGST